MGRILMGAMLSIACRQHVQAAIIAYSDPARSGNQAYGGTLGMDFQVNSPSGINVYQLGAFDSNQDGFKGTMTVQIFSLSNLSTPIVTATLSGTSGTLIGGDRFVSLATPLYLAPGAYSIVADGFTSLDLNGNSLSSSNFASLNNGGGLISFIGTSRFGGAGVFPAIVDGAVAKYGAGTFSYDVAQIQATDTPEPGTFFMLGGGMIGLAFWSRKRLSGN